MSGTEAWGPSGPSGLPATAAWEHLDVRRGFEVVRFDSRPDGIRATGSTSAVEDGRAWWVHYDVELDPGWRTRRAVVAGGSAAGTWRHELITVSPGRWSVDGVVDEALEGCIDVDLESSACTNTMPVHRLVDAEPTGMPAPAAFVRADGRGVERLEQSYRLGPTTGDGGFVVDYEAPRFDVHVALRFDRHGLVVDYPGLARRAA